MNKALEALEGANTALDGVLQHIDFNRKVGQSSMSDKKLRDMIVHFNKEPLYRARFEFPDLLGAAYEYLIRDSLTLPARRVANSIRRVMLSDSWCG